MKFLIILILFQLLLLLISLIVIIRQIRIIDAMAEDILDLSNMVNTKEYDIIPIWFGKNHILTYFYKRGYKRVYKNSITNEYYTDDD